jgi:hypothetical protein
MTTQEQCIETDQPRVVTGRFSGLKLRYALKFISSLLLPMVLGVFTLVITLQQQDMAKKQRDEDRNASRLSRILVSIIHFFRVCRSYDHFQLFAYNLSKYFKIVFM